MASLARFPGIALGSSIVRVAKPREVVHVKCTEDLQQREGAPVSAQVRSCTDKPATIGVCKGRKRPSVGRKYRHREFALRNLDIDLPKLHHQLQIYLCSAHRKVYMLSCGKTQGVSGRTVDTRISSVNSASRHFVLRL